MKWKKSFLVVMLVSMMVFATVGCGKAEEPVPTVEQPAPAVEGTGSAPLEGGAPGEGQPARAMDLATAAAKLGVTEQQLRDALGDSSQGPPDFSVVAEQLGISEESLREALGLPEGSPPSVGSGPAGKR